MRKSKIRKSKIQTKLMVPIIIMTVIFNILVCFFTYQAVERRYIQLGGKEAIAVLNMMEGSIDGDEVEQLRTEDGREELYSEMYSYINALKLRTDVKYIYIVGEVEGTYRYIFEDDDEIGELELLDKEYIKEVETALSGVSYVVQKIETTDNDEKLITAYIPIYNSKSEIVATLGVDYDATLICEYLYRLTIGLALSAVLQIIIATIIILSVSKKMKNQILQVDEKLQDLISSNGDLTQKVDVQVNDEIGDIALKINDLLAYIHTVIRNISNVTTHMNQAIQETRQSVGESVNDVEEIAASSEELNAMIEETNVNIENISSTINVIKTSLDSMSDEVANGLGQSIENRKNASVIRKEAVEEKVEIVNTSSELTASMKEKIARANEVERIKKLTDEILSIANKTSLLSLNASIEAARAGEAGRGFAVVAGEISQLSKDSAATATEIQEISQTIVRVVEELSDEANRMMQFVADKTIASYNKIIDVGEEYVKTSESVEVFLGNMNTKAEEIDLGMQEIVESIQAIHSASKECTRGIADVTKLTTNLTENLQDNRRQTIENEQLMGQMEMEVGKFII